MKQRITSKRGAIARIASSLGVYAGALAISVVSAAGCAIDDDDAAAREALVAALSESRGTACLPGDGGLYSQVQINTVDDDADFVVGLFEDATCASPLLELRTLVTREVGPAVEGIPGAFEVDVVREALFAAPFTDDAALMLEDAGCGTIAAGVVADVSSTGCLGFESVDACGFDFDIAALVDGVLFGGERGEDMCVPENRPVALGTLGFEVR